MKTACSSLRYFTKQVFRNNFYKWKVCVCVSDGISLIHVLSSAYAWCCVLCTVKKQGGEPFHALGVSSCPSSPSVLSLASQKSKSQIDAFSNRRLQNATIARKQKIEEESRNEIANRFVLKSQVLNRGIFCLRDTKDKLKVARLSKNLKLLWLLGGCNFESQPFRAFEIAAFLWR